MLKTLRRIVQEVNSAPEFSEALQILVQRVRDAIETQACSVFLLNHEVNAFVLAATDGLNPKAVGKSQINTADGLIGLVGSREEPLNLADVTSHPNYFTDPSLQEDKFKSFLGVPIVANRQLYGVLVVQQEVMREFDEAEEAFLVTMSAQIAGVIAHADATGALNRLWQNPSRSKKRKQFELTGVAASPGIAIGQLVVVYPLADLEAVPDRSPEDIDLEIVDFVQALSAARDDIRNMSARLAASLPAAEKALFDVYLRILEDNSLGKEVISEIRRGNWAQGALRTVILKHIHHFEAMEDDYLRERSDDFMDLGQRVLSHLQTRQNEPVEYPDNTILVGEEVTASALAEVPAGKLAGIISAKGSRNAHIAILARALATPAVMGIKGLDVSTLANKEAIVDGYYGQVYVSPSARLRKEYALLAKEEEELDANLEHLRDQPAETPDGCRFSLHINTGLNEDAGLSLSVGAEGVGLFRTEVSFMTRDAFPTEEEQRVIYRQLLNAFAPRPVTMRTLDIGGDKPLPYFPVEEMNPFLGWRGMRITLDRPDVFILQLRAMLRANIDLGNLRILFPMITLPSEVDEAMRLLQKAYQELIEDGEAVTMPPVGVMIEVPSAVYQAEQLARRVDFMSVGSNDLTQYLLAVDRNNAQVSGLYDCLHPAVLFALLQAYEAAQAQNIPISVCGEMAGDPVSVVLLMGMGYQMLSMSSISLPRVKWVIRNISRDDARSMLMDVLTLEDPVEIRATIEQALESAGLGGLIRAGK